MQAIRRSGDRSLSAFLLGTLLAVGQGCSRSVDAPNSSLATKGRVASQLVQCKFAEPLKVASPDIGANLPIANRFSAYNENDAPRIAWNAGPAGTRSYVLLVEDPDAPGEKPFVHWAVADCPATVCSLPGPGTVLQNQNGDRAYYGPHPPKGTLHHYWFQVFALDLPAVSASDRDSVLSSISGHVLAKGAFVATYQAP